MIAFLIHRNNHTCVPVFWCFSKFPRHLTHPCQPTYSFSVRCLQHFKSDFIFTSSLSGLQSSYCCCHFCQCDDFLFPKINCLTCAVVVTIIGFNRPSEHSLHRERISFVSLRMFPVESLMEVVVLDLFPRRRQMVSQNTLFADKKLKYK